MATDSQLQLLQDCKHCYMDGTFKLVHDPFYQLFSIHGFVQSGDCCKQVPLLNCLMSGKTKMYKKVIKAVLKLFRGKPKVKGVTMDFEIGLWKAVEKKIEDVSTKAYGSDWAQAVWRHIQEVGLQKAYNTAQGTWKLLKKVMTLPYLPADEILPTFEELLQTTTLTEQLQEFVAYVKKQWLQNPNFPPETWSVYRRKVSTSNDLEGLHHHLNHAAHTAKLPFYLLLELLQQKAQNTDITVKLVSDRKVNRIQQGAYKTSTSKLITNWDQHANGTLSVMGLLKRCAYYVPYWMYNSKLGLF